MTSSEFNIRHLRVFAKTYEKGSLLSASKAVNVTQPAATQGLARLEELLGTKLFDRLPGGMQPLPEADILYPRVSRALSYIRSPRITSTQMRALLLLAKHGSYIDAAAATGVARPSLHRAVSDLEKALGVDLVRRRGRGIELTPGGKATSRQFNLAQVELDAGVAELDELTKDSAGRLAIGAMPLCRARVLPSAVVAVQKRHQNADITIAEGAYSELIEPLRNGDLDVIIGALRDPAPGPDVVQEALFEDRPVVLARKDHPLPSYKGEVPLMEVKDYGWCVPPEGVPLRDRWQQLFTGQGVSPPRVSVECGSVIAIRQILLETDYLTVLSPDQVAVELEAGWLKIIGLAPESLFRTIGLTYREGWYPTKLQTTFVEELKKVI